MAGSKEKHEVMFEKEDAYKSLEITNSWIGNLDTKASFLLISGNGIRCLSWGSSSIFYYAHCAVRDDLLGENHLRNRTVFFTYTFCCFFTWNANSTY